MPTLLTEVNSASTVFKKDGDIYIQGEYGRVNVPTKNGRIYPEKIIQREIDKLNEDMKAGRVFGSADHPADGKTTMYNVSHILQDLKIVDGIVIGTSKVIKESLGGKQVMAIVNAGGKPGMSSRGFGSTKPAGGKMEAEEVQEDFVLKTYDCVIDPAMATAIPEFKMESILESVGNSWQEELISKYPQIVECVGDQCQCMLEDNDSPAPTEEVVERSVVETFEKQLADTLVAMREEVSSEIRESYDSDPSVGGAKSLLSQIAEMVGAYASNTDEVVMRDALQAKDEAIAEAQSDKEIAEAACETLKKKLYLEQRITGNAMAESIRKLVNVNMFESEEEMGSAVDGILENFPDAKSAGYVSESEVILREENVKLESQVSLLSEKVKGLDSRLLKAVKLCERIDSERNEIALRVSEEAETRQTLIEDFEKQIAEMQDELEAQKKLVEDKNLELYKREKVESFANGRELLGLMESVVSQKAVDEIVSKRGTSVMSDNHLERARQSVLKGSDGSSGQMETGSILSESTTMKGSVERDLERLGITMENTRALTGYKQQQ